MPTVSRCRVDWLAAPAVAPHTLIAAPRRCVGKIRVIVDEGQSVVVSSDQIAERIPGEAPIDAFEKRFARVPKDDRDGYIDLAAWGEERGLRRTSRRAVSSPCACAGYEMCDFTFGLLPNFWASA